MENPDKLLSRKEAADYLGLKENTLAVWAVRKKGYLPFIRMGGGKHHSGTVRYKLSDLVLFLENNTICYKKNQEVKKV